MQYKEKNILNNLLLIFFSILFSLYLIEFFLLSNSLIQSKQNKEKKVISKFDYFIKKKKTVPDLSPVITSLYTLNFKKKFPELFSVSTLSNVSTITCNENNYWPIIKSDKYGFFNENYIWENKNINNVFLGDSFTAGSCVYKDLNFVSIFSQLNKNNINLNLGIPGSFPFLELIKLKEYVKPLFLPKNIIWVYYEGNDLRELQNFSKKYKNTYIFNYLTNSNFTQNLIKENNNRNQILKKDLVNVINDLKKAKESKEINKKKYQYKFSNFITMTNIRKLSFERKEIQEIDSETFKFFYEILKEAKKVSTKLNSKLYFVYLPSIERYKHGYLGGLYYNNKNLDSHFKHNKVLEILDKLNIPMIDINSAIFDKVKDPLSLFPNREHHHYNEIGYKKIGKYLIDNINNH